MAILEHGVRSSVNGSLTGLQRHLYTREEYRSAAVADALGEKRVELIEGQIIDVAPIGDAHAAINHPLAELLQSVFGPAFAVRTQAPIALGDYALPSELLPDIAVVVGSWRDYISRTPNAADIRLVAEIADTTLNTDRALKSALYATARIPEYWIVNLVDRQLEVFRNPIGAGYDPAVVFRPGDAVTPPFAPGSAVLIADFMP